jgi:hypothetical protein
MKMVGPSILPKYNKKICINMLLLQMLISLPIGSLN